MSLSNNVQRPSQLADKDTALSDYFDVLLHEATITEAPVVVSQPDKLRGESKSIVATAEKPIFLIENEDSSLPNVTTSEDSHGESIIAIAAVSNQQDVMELAPITELESNPLVEASSGADVLRAVEAVSSLQADSTDLESEPDCDSGEVVVESESCDDEKPKPEEENYYVEGAPEWARRPFQALEFTIAKLKLVIPLIHLYGILDWECAELTPMPGHSKQFIGVWPNHGTNSKIVDVAEMLVPKRYHDKIETWQSRITKVVLIDDSIWGLACDEILGVVTLDPREVRWRTNRTQRAWLAGTLIGHMSALIDGDEFAATLLHGDQGAEFSASCA